MSTTYFQKPENALKRSEELISVGQRSSALDVLETVIKSKRHRQWSPILEDIVKKFLSLCTETRQPRRAREGLVQYRQITQSAPQGPDSIRKVVSTFVAEGEKSVREAEEKAGLGADAVANLQDLEAEETPETMMISVLTGDLSDTGRADRDNYVQWLRFLWESYRTCLEVLKNNAKLEELYADTAKKTFAFCVRYKRKVEFRRLKDLLKAHLSNNQLNTSYGAPTQEASLRLRLEIRSEQLNAACTLELWQLAFESAEELHGLLLHPTNRAHQKKSHVMLNYYDKVSQVFWVSDNYLFHACAMQRIYNLTERQLLRQVGKNEITREQANKSLELLASKVLLGALSVPPPPVKALDGDMDPEKDKHVRMASLVNYTNVPQRKAIIGDLVSKNIMANVPAELKEMFAFVETEFDPLNLSKRIKPLFKVIESNPELVKYLQALKQVVLLRLVQQLSQVYQTMRISDFAKLADFLSLHDCEKLIVQAVSNNQAAARLDHKNGTLNLGDKGLEGETRRSQLTNLAKGLQTSLDLMSQDKEERRRQKLMAFQELAERLEDERKMMDYRRQQIEERKEFQEREAAQKAMDDAARKKEEEEERRESEENRKAEDKKRREDDKRRAEMDEKELAEKKRLKEQVDALKKEEKKKKGRAEENFGVDVGGKQLDEVDDDDLRNIDKDALIKAKKAQEEKLKREAEERMKQAVLKLDHLERARRENERDILDKVYAEQMEQDKQRWEVESKQFMENHKKKHAEDLEIKLRMLRMVDAKSVYENMVTKRREQEHENEKKAHVQQAKTDAERRRTEREEQTRKRREDQERQEKEDEERRERLEEERERREEERTKMDAIAEKQREREKEVESKRREDAPRGGDGPRGGGGDRWGGGGGDRGDRPPMGGSDRLGGGSDRDGPRGGGGDRWGGGGGGGDRDGPRGGGGDRWGGGGGDRGDRPPMDRGGDRGGSRFGDSGASRFGDRGGGDRFGGGDRDRGDRPPMDRDGPRGGGDRFGGGGGGDRFGDRGGGDRGGGDRGGGDRFGGGGGGDRFGGGGGGGAGGWRGERVEPSGDRNRGGSDRPGDRPGGFGGGGGGGERPRLNLAPRAPREDAAPKVDDDGFATVTKKR